MIKIYPAILVSNSEKFLKQIKKYSSLKRVDIDIAKKPFTDRGTVSLSDIFEFLPKKWDIGFHFMVQKISEDDLEFLKKMGECRIYIHQESENRVEELRKILPNAKFGVVIKIESDLMDLEFYNKFDEVQVMTVNIGSQGGKFKLEAMEKCRQLRKMGFEKTISVDGGINLETAMIIRDYPVERVSVGSFFTKTGNFNESFEMLNKILCQ